MAARIMPKPLRVFIFAPHFAEYSIRLAIALSRRGPVLLALDRQNRKLECDALLWAEARKSLSIVEFDSVGRRNRLLSLVSISLRALVFWPSVINAQEQIDNLTAWVVRLLHILAPVVLTIHDPQPHAGLDTDWVTANARNRRSMRAAAAMFHVHGRFCAEQLKREAGEGRPIVETAHGAILIPEPAHRREPEAGRLLMFGRMEAYKGLGVLLDALDALHASGRRFRLALVGSGSEFDRLRPRIEAAPYIDATPHFVPPAVAIVEFQRASIVVLPYTEATQSGVASAAFGNGRPVVASRVGGLVDAVRDEVDGLLVPAGDAEALARAIDALLLDEEKLARLTQGAQEAGMTRFAWEPIAHTLNAAFADLLERKI